MKSTFVYFFFLLFLGFSGNIAAQAEADSVIKAFKTADAQLLTKYFNETVDIGLPSKDQDYGKQQGSIVMTEFFKKNPIKKFTTHEQGETDPQTRFIIGSYETDSDQYQVLILLKSKKEKYYIHKIKFE